jgi:protoheme IX farnesyltransferase
MIELMLTWPIAHTVKFSLTIAKIPLCILVAFSASFGHVFAQQDIDGKTVQIFIAVLLLACGGASYNSYQERHEDRLMRRTQGRPLVKRIISNRHAIIQSFILIFAGLVTLAVAANFKAFIAGLCGITIYNLVYTRMKSWSFYAIIPGAICGAIPPYIGWLAADGNPVSLNAVLIVLLLFFWQIPHFFLVMLNHRTDYLHSVSPNMLKYFKEPALQRIFMPWITALAATMITFTAIPLPLTLNGRYVILGNTLLLLILFSYQLFFTRLPNYKLLFQILNLSLLIFMLTVCYELVWG